MSSPSTASIASEKSARPLSSSRTPDHDAEKQTYPPLPPSTIQAEQNRRQDEDPYLAKWEPGEPGNPFNWSNGYKWWVTAQLSLLAFAASFASSVTAPADPIIAEYVHVSQEAAVLSISLYVLGFAFGPLLWAPISEIWGRRMSMLPAMFALGLFSIGTATSKNAAGIFITRFFGGVFGSAPVSNVSAGLGDFWEAKIRGIAVTIYACAVVGGPTLGPVVASALTVNPHLGWRWTEYLTAILVFATFALTLFCLPEMYGPFLLKNKARRLRKETGDPRHHHPHEDIKFDFKSIVTKHFSRPLIMLTTEPMVTVICLYASFVFALLYATLEVFPIVFYEQRHWALFNSTLPFVSLFVGVLLGIPINLANQPRYARISEAAGGRKVPEARLPPMIIGAFAFAIGLFFFGWTADPSIHWICPVIAAAFIGMGFNMIFQQCINFLVDTYQLYAASATSANTFLRSLLGCGLPLVARPMFHNLGVGPAMSILGAIAVLMLPVPFLFMKYGLALRKKSRFAPVED